MAHFAPLRRLRKRISGVVLLAAVSEGMGAVHERSSVEHEGAEQRERQQGDGRQARTLVAGVPQLRALLQRHADQEADPDPDVAGAAAAAQPPPARQQAVPRARPS